MKISKYFNASKAVYSSFPFMKEFQLLNVKVKITTIKNKIGKLSIFTVMKEAADVSEISVESTGAATGEKRGSFNVSGVVMDTVGSSSEF